MFCSNCGTSLPPNTPTCSNCGVPAGEGNHFCKSCGNQTNGYDLFCSKCGSHLGVQQNQSNNNQNYQAPPYAAQGNYNNQGYPPPPPFVSQQKSRMVAGLLAIFLGTLGVHNFYLGYSKKAVTQLLISIIGGFVTCGIATTGVAIWALIEAVQIFIGNVPTDADGIPLRD